MPFSDTKNWTWVLERPCPECGFDAAHFPADRVPDRLKQTIPAWKVALSRDDARRRPAPDRWSSLEYGCHVRDVYVIFDQRLQRMLSEDDPLFANWDQDASAIDNDYAGQDPEVVAVEIEQAANHLARRIESVTGGQWDRTGRRSDGSAFTVDSLTRYMIHDPIHHLHDVGIESTE